MWRFRFIIYLKHSPPSPLGRNRFTILLNSPPHHISGTRTLICQLRFFTFAKVLNPPPNFSQTRGRGRTEKESGGVWGAAPAICNHNVSIRGSERIHMRAVFAGRMSFSSERARRRKQAGRGADKAAQNTDRQLV